MTAYEKAAYLKGLADGINFGEQKDCEKLLRAIIDTIGDLAEVIDDIDEDLNEIVDQLDAVDTDLADLEDYVYECGEDWDDDCCCGDDDELYEIDCPACGEVITIDGDILDEGSMKCPACGELLEFDFDCDCDDCADED